MAKVRALMSGAGTAPVLESLYATENGEYTPSQGVDGFNEVTVAVPEPVIVTKNIVANGTYNAIDDNASGYSSVFVNVPTGAEGVIVGSTDPVSSQGVDGDYYYKRVPMLMPTITGWTYQNSTSNNAGIAFTVNSELTITGIRVYNRDIATIGIIKLGTTSPMYTSGNIVIPSGWYSHKLPSPITLLPGLTYSLMVENMSDHISYTPISALSSSVLDNINGIYGSYPGTIDSVNAYAIDVMIDDPNTVYVTDQYKKVNGVWTLLSI